MRIALGDKLLCRIFDPMMRPLRGHLTRLAEIRTGQRVLDVCCGPGSQVFHFARNKATATGIDLDPLMIRWAEKTRRRRGLLGASFQIASALHLPFWEDSFDCASVAMALHELERQHRSLVVSEMKRVVVGNGRLLFLDYAVPLPRTPSAYLSLALEYLSGPQHHACFRDYVAHGGLAGLLRETQLQTETTIRLGPVVVTVTGNAES